MPGPLSAAIAALAAAGTLASPAAGAPTVRIDSLRIVGADGRPTAPPYRRAARNDYLVTYRVGGARIIRVTRAATLLTAGGIVIATVRPRSVLADPGAYRARARLRIGPTAPAGLYVLRYTVLARGDDGSVARTRRVLRLRFR